MSQIYFIQNKETGLVKIGYASDVRQRFGAVQSASGSKLELLAHFPGGKPEEQALHEKLAAHRIRGEWFAPAPAVMACVAEALDHDQCDPDDPDAGRRNAVAERQDAFMRESFRTYMLNLFGPGSAGVRMVASLCDVCERTAANWLEGPIYPNGISLMRIASRVPEMNFWLNAMSAALAEALRSGRDEREIFAEMEDGHANGKKVGMEKVLDPILERDLANFMQGASRYFDRKGGTE